MATIGEISAAINLIDDKKEDLHKSFLHLQSQSPSSFTSTLKWADLDSYFTSLSSSLQRKFNLLQTIYPQSDTMAVLARPELKSFCQNSDGLGLMRFIAIPGDRLSVLAELPDAYRCSQDAAAMVLDAVTTFYRDNALNCKSSEFRSCQKNCVIMLEGLLRAKPEVTIELKNKAMEMVQGNRKRVTGNAEEKLQNTLEFLLLVGAYGLIDRISMDELVDCFAIVTRRKRQVIDLCRLMILDSNLNDLIQKLISKGMHVAAVYYSIEFQKTDEFPPLRLLEERKITSMRIIEEIRKKGDNFYQNEVALKEIGELNSIIKCIDVFKLEYPKDAMVDLVKELGISKRAQRKNDKGSKKQPSTQFVSKKPPTVFKKQPTPLQSKKPKANQITKKPKANKFLRAAVPTSTTHVMPLHQPNSQASDMLPDHLGQYQNSLAASGPGPAGLYGLTGASIGYSGNQLPAGAGPSFYPTHTQSQPPSDMLPDHLGQYQNSVAASGPGPGPAGPYGLTGANIGYSGNQLPAGAGPSFYPPHTQSQPPSVYNSNGGFGYHPPYYPQ